MARCLFNTTPAPGHVKQEEPGAGFNVVLSVVVNVVLQVHMTLCVVFLILTIFSLSLETDLRLRNNNNNNSTIEG